MKSYSTLLSMFQTLSQNSSNQNQMLGSVLINDNLRYLLQRYFDNERAFTMTDGRLSSNAHSHDFNSLCGGFSLGNSFDRMDISFVSATGCLWRWRAKNSFLHTRFDKYLLDICNDHCADFKFNLLRWSPVLSVAGEYLKTQNQFNHYRATGLHRLSYQFSPRMGEDKCFALHRCVSSVLLCL